MQYPIADLAFDLTDKTGPRLTNSPNFRKAVQWAAKQLGEFGLENVKIEKWPFGRGWAATRFSAHMLEPDQTSLIIVPRPWTPGTNGVVTAEAVYLPPPSTDAEAAQVMEKHKGKLKGKIVLTSELAQIEIDSWRR